MAKSSEAFEDLFRMLRAGEFSRTFVMSVVIVKGGDLWFEGVQGKRYCV